MSAKQDPSIVKMQSQIKREIKLADGLKTCPRQSFDPSNIKSLNQQKALQEFNKFSFFEVGVMESLFCAFDTNITIANPTDYTANDKVISFFKNLRQIGADSVEGFALFAGFKDIKDLFVIKVPRDPNNDNLFHEYFIGVACLNKLRRFVPNFSYVFGAFNCLPPVIASNKDVTQWCSKGNKGNNGVNYVIFEKIEGPSMKKVAEQISEGEISFTIYFSYLIQTFLALRIAWASCGFTHYDLHDENIIIRKIPGQKKIYVPYPIGSGDDVIYIRTDGIPTLIDYGRCHIRLKIKKKEESFGFYGFEGVGLYPNKARPLHDLYKITGFSMFSVARSKSSSADKFLVKAWPLFNMWSNIKKQNWNPLALSGQKARANEIREALAVERANFFEVGKNLISEELKQDPIISVVEDMTKLYNSEWNEINRTLEEIPDKDIVLDCNNLLCVTAAEVKNRLTQ